MADPKGSPLFYWLSDEWACLIGAFVGGFVDSAGYIKLQGVFTSSITGNLVVAVTSVVTMTGVIARSCVCISFILGAWISSSTSLRLRLFHGWNMRMAAMFMFAMELAIFIATLIVGLELDDQISSSKNLDDWEVVLVGSLLGASMGIHALTIKECIANSPSTTVMTMTMVTFGSQLASTIEYLLASQGCLQLSTKPLPTDPTERSASLLALQKKYVDFRDKLWVTAKPLLIFTIGAILGAVIMRQGSFWCLMIPIFFKVYFIVLIVIREVVERGNANANANANAKGDNKAVVTASTTSAPSKGESGTSSSSSYQAVPATEPSNVNTKDIEVALVSSEFNGKDDSVAINK